MTEATPSGGPVLAPADMPLEPEDFGEGGFGEQFLPGPETDEEREQREQAESDLDPRSQEDVVGLMHLGYLEETCIVAGHEFTLRTPWHNDRIERGELHKSYIGSANFEPMWEMITVAAYLHSCDEQELPQPLGREGAVKTRLDWVKRSIFSQYVIRKLYGKTVELDARERAVVEYVDDLSKS